MKTFVSKHKYKLLFLLIIIIAFSGVFLYSKRKKTKDSELPKETPDTVLSAKQQPKEPLIVDNVATEEAPIKEVVKPAIIETKDSPK